MKAVHVVVPGSSRGALALCFSNARELGLAAQQMLAMAKLGNCNICFNSPGIGPEQAKLNGEMAAFEARLIPPYEVSRIETPEASHRMLIAMPIRLGALSLLSGDGVGSSDGKGSPQFTFVSSPSEAKASVGVTQPWTKQGITKEDWEDGLRKSD